MAQLNNYTTTAVSPHPAILPLTTSIEPTKVCSICGEELPLSNYSHHKRTADGYFHMCKKCQGIKGVKALYKHRVNRAKSSAVQTSPAIVPMQGYKKTLTLDDFTDAQLVAELARRGYTGSVAKTTTLTI